MQKNNRNDRQIVTYAMLLAAAHRSGLQRIETAIVQIPDESNGRTAICRACVTVEQGGKVKVFQAVGDAAPNNVSAQMQTCLLRMSETRAKARALRDALGQGAVAAEELPDYAGDSDQAAEARPMKREQQDASAPILTTQEAAIKSLCRVKSLEVPEGLGNYTFGQAADLLRSLQERN